MARQPLPQAATPGGKRTLIYGNILICYAVLNSFACSIVQSCGGVTHAVASGDTCDSIGQAYGMSCAQVQALNPKAFAADGTAVQGLTLCIGESDVVTATSGSMIMP